MRITLFSEKNSYIFKTHDINEVSYSNIIGEIVYDYKGVPIGRIATTEDLDREKYDCEYE